MVVDRNGQRHFGTVLTNDVFVEDGLDFLRLRKRLCMLRVTGRAVALPLQFFADDFVAEVDTFIADEYAAGTCNQFFHFILGLAAE